MNPKKRALAETLLEHIRQGNIVEQGKLPPERTLAAMLGEKRPQVREAILILEAWGILDVRDRQGIFLASSEVPDFSSGLEHMMP
ncbi:MAG TPA: GntR family transcriptional regulator, partial [Synergistaceae bacterium]|nr:GntR family transcriptional regulator [Synergistaceae bacterium]